MARTVLTVDLEGNDKSMSRTFKKGEASASKMSDGLSKMTGVVAGATAALTTMGIDLAGAAIEGVIGFGKEIAGLSTTLELTQGKAATVFEDFLVDIERWADKSAAAMGLTNNEAIGLASNFADLLKPMGFTAREAGLMAQDVVGLSGALAEWSEGKVDAAGAARELAKAMLGEREGLKTLGISISESDVTARLAAKGQKDLTGELLQQAKAVATQELIFEKSLDAQKAYAEGSGTLARKQAELSAAWGSFKESIALAVTPLLHVLVPALTGTVIPALELVSGKVTEFIDGFRDALELRKNPVGLTIQTELGPLPGLWERDELGGLVEIESANEQFAQAIDDLFGLGGKARAPIASFVDFIETVPERVGGAVAEIKSFFEAEDWAGAETETARFIAAIRALWESEDGGLAAFFENQNAIIAAGTADESAWGAYLGNQERIMAVLADLFEGNWEKMFDDASASVERGWVQLRASFSAEWTKMLAQLNGIRDAIQEWMRTLPFSDELFGFWVEATDPGRTPTGGVGRRLGGRAAGGPQSFAQTVTVGEAGPERVRLPAGSEVTANHSDSTGGGAGVTVNVTVQGSVLSQRDLVEQITEAARRGFAFTGATAHPI